MLAALKKANQVETKESLDNKKDKQQTQVSNTYLEKGSGSKDSKSTWVEYELTILRGILLSVFT